MICVHDTENCVFVWFQGTEDAVSSDTTSTSKSKQDSGLSRTDDSIKTEESSEQVGTAKLGCLL